jgi:hypothetical protein
VHIILNFVILDCTLLSSTVLALFAQKFSNMVFKSPLEGYENADPLPTTFNADEKSLFNPPGPRSEAYEKFLPPINPSKNGFDFHSKSSKAQSIVAVSDTTTSSLLYAVG